jgi:hypothetical protein
MNLWIADARGLVDFLHRTVSSSGKRTLTCGVYDVVEIDGALFFSSGPGREAWQMGRSALGGRAARARVSLE